MNVGADKKNARNPHMKDCEQSNQIGPDVSHDYVHKNKVVETCQRSTLMGPTC